MRGGDGDIREKVAAGVGRVLINAQIAAPLRLSENCSPLSAIRRILSN
jgi:hypothetical protein